MKQADRQREGLLQTWRFLSLGRNDALEFSLAEPGRSLGVEGSATQGGMGVGGGGNMGER